MNRCDFKKILSLSVSLLAITSTEAYAQTQNDEELSEPVDVIVVRGIKQSLEDAREAKRSADQIMDAISAEDIGKLPDTNVAEALQRITGVQINRDLGEGSEIAVRGFTQTRIEVNGQTQVGAGSGDGVTFQSVPSDAFKSLEVIKTPSADDVEGGIGAIIRLQTRKPLDRPKFIMSGKLQGQHADRADKNTINGNFLVSNAWESDKLGQFGALFNYTRNNRKLRQDQFFIRGWNSVNGFGRDLDGDGIAGEPIEYDDGVVTDLQDGVYVPEQTILRMRLQDRKLDSFSTALQWRPSEKLELYLDGTYTESSQSDALYQYNSAFNSANQNDPNNPGRRIRPVYQDPANAVISDDQTFLSGVFGQIRGNGTAQRGVNLNIAGNTAPNERTITTYKAGTIWEPTEKLAVEASFAYGGGDTVAKQAFLSNGVAFNDWPFFYADFGADADIPTVVPLLREQNGLATTELSDAARIDLADIGTYVHTEGVYQIQYENNDETALELDFDYDVNIGPIKKLEFGFRYTDRLGERRRDRGNDKQNGDDDGTLAGMSFEDLDALLPGFVVRQPNDNVLDGATGDFVQDWFTLDPKYLTDNYDQILETGGITLAPDVGWGFRVERETQAVYAKANFEGVLNGLGWDYRGNFGVRVVGTDQLAIGTLNDGTTIVPFEGETSYTDVLPSANVTLAVSEDMLIRLGAAKTISRPTIVDVAPLVNLQFFAASGSSGNPDLNPEEVTQFDVSVERYFGKSNLISAAYFYKDFQERIEGGIQEQCFTLPAGDVDESPGDDGCLAGQELIRLDVPVNVGKATVHGFELGYQQTFDFLPAPFDGLGAIANFTKVDIDGGASISATGLSLPVQDLSENSYNLIGFYEKGPVSGRLAYNWRDTFYDERTSTNNASFAEPYGQLDGSMSYDIGDKFTLTFEALNLLNEPEIRYQELRERLVAYRVNDKRFLFGIRGRF